MCDVTYADNNSNNPNDAIYLGFAEGRKNLIDKPVFIHQQSSCIVKARKKDVLDKSGKFVYCIVCGHRINPSEKILSGGGIIKQNGYLVDTNAWIHRPLPLHNYHPMKKKYEDFVISSCYEKAFGHSNFPPEDILSKRAKIIEKYVNRTETSTKRKNNYEELQNKEIKSKNFSKLNESIVGLETELNLQENKDIRGIMYSIGNNADLALTWSIFGPLFVGVVWLIGITNLWVPLAGINTALFLLQCICVMFGRKSKSSSTLHEDHASSIGESSFDE